MKPKLTVPILNYQLITETLAIVAIAILNGYSRGRIRPNGASWLRKQSVYIVVISYREGLMLTFYAEYKNEKLLMELACSVM